MVGGVDDFTPDERAAIRLKTRELANAKIAEGWSPEDVKTNLSGFVQTAIKNVTGRGLKTPESVADVLRREAQEHPIKSSLLAGASSGIEGATFGLVPMPEVIGKMSGEPDLARAYMGEQAKVANQNTTNRIISGVAGLPAIYPAARLGGIAGKAIGALPGAAIGFGAQEALQPEVTKAVSGRETEGTIASRFGRGAAAGAAIPLAGAAVGATVGRALPKALRGVAGSSGGMAAYEAVTGGDPLAGAAIGAAAHPLLKPLQFAEKRRAQALDEATIRIGTSPVAKEVIREAAGRGPKEARVALEAVRELAEEKVGPPPSSAASATRAPGESPRNPALPPTSRRAQVRQEAREFAKQASEVVDTPKNALGIVPNPNALKVPGMLADRAKRLSNWLFDATVWDQKKAMKARMRFGEEVEQSVSANLRQSPRLAAYLGFRDFDPWMQGIRQWAEDRGGRARVLTQEIQDRLKGLPEERVREIVMATEKGQKVAGFEDLQRKIHATAQLAARRQIRQREDVGDVAGEKRGIARETAAQYQQPDTKYLKRIPALEFAKKRGPLGSILNVLSGGTSFKRGPNDLPVMKLKGIAGGARAVEPAVKSAQTARRPLTTEQAAGYRVFTTDGQMLVGKSVKDGKTAIELEKWDGTKQSVPKNTIQRVEEPYVYSGKTLERTVEETAAIGIQLKISEAIKDERKDLWREPKNDGNPLWEKAEGAGFGVLEGKQVRADVMELLKFYKDPVENGLIHFLATGSALTKMGMVVGRVPGGTVKQVPEMILTAMQLGVSPSRLVAEIPKKIRDISRYLTTGEAPEWVRGLQGADLWQKSTYEISAGLSGKRAADYRPIEGRRVQYLRELSRTAAQDLATRLNAVADKMQKGRVKVAWLYSFAEIQRTVADFFYGFNPVQALTGKSKVLGVRTSGEGLKDAFAMIDNVFRGVIYDDLRAGKLPFHQRLIRKVAGKSTTGTRFEPDEAAQYLTSALDPRNLSPAMQPLRKYTFLSIPYMLTKHALTGGAVTAPLGTAALWYTGKLVTLGTIAMLRALGHDVDEEEVERQQLRLANGDQSRADQFALIPEPADAQGNYRFFDTRSISMEGGVGVAALEQYIPGLNVDPAENETSVGRAIRGAAAMAPYGSLAYEAATGKLALTGTKLKTRSLPYIAARMATPYIPGAATAANWISDVERDAKAMEPRGTKFQRSSTTNRLLRAAFGLPVYTSAATGTPGARGQDRFIEYIQRKQAFIEGGGQFHNDPTMPKRPDFSAPPEEWQDFRDAMKRYSRLKGKRR